MSTERPIVDTRMRANLIVGNHGKSSDQKDLLVDAILEAFKSPDKWPMTDSERCKLLREWYRMAQMIRTTEDAEKHI